MRSKLCRPAHYLLAAAATLLPLAPFAPRAVAEEMNAEQMSRSFTPAVMLVVGTLESETGMYSQGTGFLVTEDGLMVTNYHVIAGCGNIQVKSSSGGVYNVSNVLAGDKKKDIAILQVEGRKFPSLELGNSDTMEPGMRVTVIGNPKGLESTITEGIVSAKRSDEAFGRMIQISAPISHGSSGSPVFNSSGKVIGMATLATNGDAQALNFAVTSNSIATMLAKARIAAKKGGGKALATADAGGGDSSAESGGGDEGGGMYKPNPSVRGSKQQDAALLKDARFQEFKKLEKNHDYFALLSIAKDAVKDYPQSALAYRMLSDSYFYARLSRDAFAAAYKALDLAPESPRAWNNLATLTADFGRSVNKSADIYAYAIKLAPDDAKLLIGVARIAGGHNQPLANSALKHARELLMAGKGMDDETRTYPLFAQTVDTYIQIKQYDDAFDTAMAFLHKTTDSPELYVSYARAASKTHRLTYVQPALDKAISLDHDIKKSALIVQAETQFDNGNREAAIETYKQACSLDNTDMRALTSLCYLVVYKDKLSRDDIADLNSYVDKMKRYDPESGKKFEAKMVKILNDRQP